MMLLLNIEELKTVVSDIIDNSRELHSLSACITINGRDDNYIAIHYDKNCMCDQIKSFDFNRIRHIIEDYGNFRLEEIEIGETTNTTFKIYKIL